MYRDKQEGPIVKKFFKGKVQVKYIDSKKESEI